MPKKYPIVDSLQLEKFVTGGQVLGQLADGRKLFAWGGLPNETVDVQITKKKSAYAEGVVVDVHKSSLGRVEPRDGDSYLSTSPWQILNFEVEQSTKAQLIGEAFELHHLNLADAVEVYTDGQDYAYRNKLEFSWYWNHETDELDLAFYQRGTHRKIPVAGSSLAADVINQAAIRLRDILRYRQARGSSLKTALIRSNRTGQVIVQLYVKDTAFPKFSDGELAELDVAGFDLIYSNPQSPASVITEYIQRWGLQSLTDSLLGIDFTYATEGFFQINLPVYEQALRDIADHVDESRPVVDLYSGVGTIGLTVTDNHLTLVEINESAVREMNRNIEALNRANSRAILSASEKVLDTIVSGSTIIVDPPRAGLDDKVVGQLNKVLPERIIYLSCNPVTQARDVARLVDNYDITYIRGYNFFPHTPHIENLIVLDKKSS